MRDIQALCRDHGGKGIVGGGFEKSAVEFTNAFDNVCET